MLTAFILLLGYFGFAFLFARITGKAKLSGDEMFFLAIGYIVLMSSFWKEVSSCVY